MSVQNKTQFDPAYVSLQETVIIGYADIAAAGCRALLGLSSAKQEVSFEVPIPLPAEPCCAAQENSDKSAKNGMALKHFLVYNTNYLLYSIVIINTHVPAKATHILAKYLTDACQLSFVRKVFVLSALRLDLLEGPIRRMYENVWNGMAPVTNCKALPSNLKFADSFLSNLIQIFLVEGIPFSCLTCPANKAEAGMANDTDGSIEVITTMQEYLNDFTHLGFSRDKSNSLIYKGNPGEIADMVAMIYV